MIHPDEVSELQSKLEVLMKKSLFFGKNLNSNLRLEEELFNVKYFIQGK